MARRTTAVVIISIVCLWGLAISIGLHLPYLRSDVSLNLRLCVLFPAILLPLSYIAFFYRGRRGDSPTGYALAMSGLPSNRERVLATVNGMIGLVLIPLFVAWSSFVLTAWATELAARAPTSQLYQVVSIRRWGGPLWSMAYDLTLRRQDNHEGFVLPIGPSAYEDLQLVPGDLVCVSGRTWLLGTIADQISKGRACP